MLHAMNFCSFLSSADGKRARRTLANLHRHRIEALVLTGGFATELHLLQRGLPVSTRPLNDIDFLVGLFGEIPTTLGGHFIFRHVHPHDPPGKTLLQAVDPDTAVRADVFRAYGGEMERANCMEIDGLSMRVIGLNDLIARAARLCLDLMSHTPVPAKHARDFLRMLPFADRDSIEPIWQEHRKPSHPESFAEAATQINNLIPLRKDLQIEVECSRDVHANCSRCEPTAEFPLADAVQVLSLLGYC